MSNLNIAWIASSLSKTDLLKSKQTRQQQYLSGSHSGKGIYPENLANIALLKSSVILDNKHTFLKLNLQ
jgi:hypothetical protein